MTRVGAIGRERLKRPTRLVTEVLHYWRLWVAGPPCT